MGLKLVERCCGCPFLSRKHVISPDVCTVALLKALRNLSTHLSRCQCSSSHTETHSATPKDKPQSKTKPGYFTKARLKDKGYFPPANGHTRTLTARKKNSIQVSLRSSLPVHFIWEIKFTLFHTKTLTYPPFLQKYTHTPLSYEFPSIF